MFQDYSKEQLFALFDDYLHGRLSLQTMQEVQNELDENAAFKDEFTNFKLLVDGIREYEKMELKNYLKSINDSSPISPAYQRNTGLYYNIAVAVLLTASFILLFSISFNSTSPASGEQLFVTYYQVPEELPLPSSRGNIEINRTIQEAYKSESYVEAEELMSNEEELLSENDEYLLSLAIIHINRNKYHEALNLLNQIQSQKIPLIYQKEWYQALVHLRLGNIEAARMLFSKLSKTESVYAQNSENILQQLK